MLAKTQRFHGHNGVRTVYSKGRSVYTTHIKLLYVSREHAPSRAAVVVSKKVHKSAVVRNRIRRRIYSHLAKQPFMREQGYDLVCVLTSDQPAQCTPAELATELDQLFHKAALIERRQQPPLVV